MYNPRVAVVLLMADDVDGNDYDDNYDDVNLVIEP